VTIYFGSRDRKAAIEKETLQERGEVAANGSTLLCF